jgi:hypothetical protein
MRRPARPDEAWPLQLRCSSSDEPFAAVFVAAAVVVLLLVVVVVVVEPTAVVDASEEGVVRSAHLRSLEPES